MAKSWAAGISPQAPYQLYGRFSSQIVGPDASRNHVHDPARGTRAAGNAEEGRGKPANPPEISAFLVHPALTAGHCSRIMRVLHWVALDSIPNDAY